MKKFLFITFILLMKLGFALQSDELKSDKEKIFILLKKAQLMEDQLKFDSVFMYYDTIYDIAMQGNDSVFLYYADLFKSKSYINKGDKDTAKIILTDIWNFAYKNRIDTLQAQAENYLGSIYLNERLMVFALKYFESALSLFEKEKDTLSISFTYNYLSNYYLDAGEYNKSLDYSLKALRLCQEIGGNQTLYMKYLFTLGNVYEIMKLYDSAEICYRKVYDFGLQTDNLRFAYRSLSNIGLMYYHKGNVEYKNNNMEMATEYFGKARELYLQSIENIEPIGDKGQLSLYYGILGPIYRKLGEYDNARRSYEKALTYSIEARDVGKQIMNLKNIGMLYRTEGDYQIAKKYLNESLQLAKSVDDKVGERNAYNSLAVLYEMMGDYKEANSYLNEYIELYKSIIENEKIKDSQEMLFLFEREKDRGMIKDLQSQSRINQLEGEKMKFERRTSYGVFSALIVILLMILLYLRMKSRKNQIIANQKIKQLEDEKKLLEALSVIVGQEQERKRIAQELHDGIGVLLSTASIHFSAVSKASGDSKTIEMMEKAELLLKQAGGEVRKISQNMMPVVLSKFGLFEALEDMFENLDELDELEVSTNIDVGKERLPENAEIMLFRVIQEMINNTLKHAKAKNIWFSCKKENGNMLIDYKDDGIGFDFENLPHNKSLGVFGIKSRVDFLKGKLIVNTGLGKGIHYHIILPVDTQEGV